MGRYIYVYEQMFTLKMIQWFSLRKLNYFKKNK